MSTKAYLKAIEASSLRNLNFLHEPFNKVLVDNAVRGGKEGQDVFDEMLLIVLEFGPVIQIAG